MIYQPAAALQHVLYTMHEARFKSAKAAKAYRWRPQMYYSQSLSGLPPARGFQFVCHHCRLDLSHTASVAAVGPTRRTSCNVSEDYFEEGMLAKAAAWCLACFTIL